MKLSNIIALIGVITILSISDSCYKHEEGCRDINALNYDVVADVDCPENCCKYPKVSMDFNLVFDTLNIDTSTYFTNNAGDSLRIKLLRMYFSDFSLIESSGEIHPLYNEINLGIGNDSITDYKRVVYTSVKINEKGGIFDLGTLDKLSIYTEMNFIFGIDSLINHSNIDKITSSSYLHQFSDSMYVDRQEGYYFMKLILDIKDKSEKSITIKGDENTQRLSIKGNIDFSQRENHILPVKINLKEWMYDIDFVNQSDVEVRQTLMQNLKLALMLRDK